MINQCTFEEFIESNTKNKNICRKYKEYPIEIQKIIKDIYIICRRAMLSDVYIIYILDTTLINFNEIKEKYIFMKRKIVNYDEIIKIKKDIIKNLKKEILECEKQRETLKHEKKYLKYTIKGIADYLGVSRQTIYNLKKRGELK